MLALGGRAPFFYRGVYHIATDLQLKPLTPEEVNTIYKKCLDFISKRRKKRTPKALKILEKAGAQETYDVYMLPTPGKSKYGLLVANAVNSIRVSPLVNFNSFSTLRNSVVSL